MSAYEWADLASSHLSNVFAIFAITLTLASAYLATAYVIGKQLTRTQLMLINLVFIPTLLFTTFSNMRVQLMYTSARNYAHELESKLSAFPDYAIVFSYIFSLFISLGILLICIKFMQDVRKTKKDEFEEN